MPTRYFSLVLYLLVLLTLLYFFNAWGQSVVKLVKNNGVGAIVIALLFTGTFCYLKPVNTIGKPLFIAFILYLAWAVILQPM